MELNEKVVSALVEKLNLTQFAEEQKLDPAEVIIRVLTPSSDAEGSEPDEVVESFMQYVAPLKVYNNEELERLKENTFNEGKQAGVGEGVGNTYGAMDKRIYERFGIAKKSDDQKTLDYIDMVIDDKSKSLGKEPSKELERYKEMVRDKSSVIDTLNSTIEQIKSEAEQNQKQWQIDSVMRAEAGKIDIDVDEELIPSQRDFLNFKMSQKYDVDLLDGQVVFKNKATGKIEKDDKTGDPKTPETIFKEFAPTVVKIKSKEPKQQGVQNGGAGLKATPIKQEHFDGLNLREFKTGKDLEEYMIKSGHSVHDQKVREVMDKWYDTVGKDSVKKTAIEDLY